MLSNNKTGAHALSRGDDRKSCAPQLDDGAETQHVYISRLVVPFNEDMGDAYGPDLAGLRAPSPAVSSFGAIPIAGKLRVLDLFSGIGGFSLGLERTGGFETVAFCEIEAFPRKVLAKHWPDVPCYTDVRELTGERLRADGISSIDVITGGFPCQDISNAGSKAGIDGERSGLWREFARIIGELRPRFVIVENSAALLDRGMGDVLGSLAALRYDAEWHCIPAAALGAPHIRDRTWIVAHADESGWRAPWAGEVEAAPADCLITGRELGEARSRAPNWPNRSDIPGIVDGIPDIVDRGAALGNSVLPQIPELIGNAILTALHQRGDQFANRAALAAPGCVSLLHSETDTPGGQV